MMPSCVPAGDFDTSGAILDAEALAKYVKHPAVLGLGEVMNSTGIMRCDSELYRKLALYHDKMIDGHAPMMYGKMLQTYRLAGVMTDHESTSGEEAAEKLRAGLAVLIREGSGARNLDSLIQILIDGECGQNGLLSARTTSMWTIFGERVTSIIISVEASSLDLIRLRPI